METWTVPDFLMQTEVVAFRSVVGGLTVMSCMNIFRSSSSSIHQVPEDVVDQVEGKLADG